LHAFETPQLIEVSQETASGVWHNAGMNNTHPAQLACTEPKQRPETIRLPTAGTRCPYTGLSRSTLNNLILPCPLNGFKPPVRSFSIKRRNAVRGLRLICYESLIAYLYDFGTKNTLSTAEKIDDEAA
jgi:hypothetical protein